MTGVTPKDLIGLKDIPLVNSENTLPEDGLYDYLIQLGEDTMTSTREPLTEHHLRRPTG